MDEKLRDMLAAGQRQKVKEELRRLLSDCNLWYMTTNSGDENSYESKKARKEFIYQLAMLAGDLVCTGIGDTNTEDKMSDCTARLADYARLSLGEGSNEENENGNL